MSDEFELNEFRIERLDVAGRSSSFDVLEGLFVFHRTPIVHSYHLYPTAIGRDARLRSANGVVRLVPAISIEPTRRSALRLGDLELAE